MKCKYMKTKIGNIPYCKIKKKEINYRLDCINCKYYEFDKKHVNYSSLNKKADNLPKNNKKSLKIDKNSQNQNQKKSTNFSGIKKIPVKSSGIKKRSYKLVKLERNRFSILTTDLDHCYICGRKKDNIHEVYEGAKRIQSIKYGCVIPLCYVHHLQIHNNRTMALFYKKLMQAKFIEVYSDLNFIDIFKINYL